jgi:hypothetical protein
LRKLGDTKIESTVRYLGLNVEDPLVPAAGTEVSRCVELLDLSVEGLLHVWFSLAAPVAVVQRGMLLLHDGLI